MIQSELLKNELSVSVHEYTLAEPREILVRPEEYFRLGTLLRPSSDILYSFVGTGVNEPANGTWPLCIPPGVALRACIDRAALNEDIVVNFSREFFERLTGHSGDLSHTELYASLNVTDQNIFQALKRLAAEMRAPGMASSVLQESLSITILVDLYRHMVHASTKDSNRLRTLSRRQRDILDDRIHQDGPAPSIAELAGLCGLSERQLIRLFKRCTGTTLHAYVEDVRLKRATEMLSSSDLCLKEIAFRLGFAAPSSFSNAFRRLTGNSPRVYRQTARLSSPRNGVSKCSSAMYG